MLSIWTERLYRDVVESFIKYVVNSNFILLRFNIVPNDVLCGMWDISKEDTFSSFILEYFCLNSKSTGLNLTAKTTEILEVVFLSGQQMNRGRTLSISRNRISDTQDMQKSKGLVCDGKTGTNQTTVDTIGDSIMSTFDRTILWQKIRTGRKSFVLVSLEKVSDIWVSI